MLDMIIIARNTCLHTCTYLYFVACTNFVSLTHLKHFRLMLMFRCDHSSATRIFFLKFVIGIEPIAKVPPPGNISNGGLLGYTAMKMVVVTRGETVVCIGIWNTSKTPNPKPKNCNNFCLSYLFCGIFCQNKNYPLPKGPT